MRKYHIQKVNEYNKKQQEEINKAKGKNPNNSKPVRGPNINNPQWICNEEAPKGWGKFYSDKLKRQKKLRKQYVEN